MPNRHAYPRADRTSMERMLQCLPVQHQEIIVATYFRGCTTSEAARRLGLPPATAKARLFQAMSDLSLMLGTEFRRGGPSSAARRHAAHAAGTRPRRAR